jgi:hypothetical protein
MANRNPQPRLSIPPASPEETAAIMAAVERFWRAAAPAAATGPAGPDPWLRAAILEQVSTRDDADLRDPWINT